jgi:FeS assembly SUF system protein
MNEIVETVKSLFVKQPEPEPPTREQLIEALRSVFDPEIPLNIYDLGLIYRLEINNQGRVEIDMTLTAPGCPVAGSLPVEVGRVIDAIPGVEETVVHMVWSPAWSKERMSEEAQLQLGLL